MPDIRYAFRRLLKSPGFNLIAIATLAIGIGANSAIFSVVNAVLLKPLPYPQPDRLVQVFHVFNGRRTEMSGPDFTDLTNAAKSFENTAAVNTGHVVLTGAGEPVRILGADVSASLFTVLRVRPALGRGFTAEEDTPDRTNVVVLSYGLWQQRFGGAADAIGKRVEIDAVPKTIVGVMPAGFDYPVGATVWLPIAYDAPFVSVQRGAWYLDVIARLKPGVTTGQSAAEAQAIGRDLARRYPDDDGNVEVTTVPLHEAIVGDVGTPLLILFGMVGFVLLIACANVANLLLARAASRESEMAVRGALGAGRGRLVRQLLTESVILALAGGVTGLLLAVWGVAFLTSLQPAGLPRLQDVRVDAAVTLFALGLAMLTGIVFGLVPAIHSTRRGLSSALKSGGRGAITNQAGARVRGALVVVEMVLAVLLVVGAGLLIRSFVRLQSVDPGFSADRTLAFDLTMPDVRYKEDAKRIAFFDQLLGRISALPGVTSSGAAMALPLGGTDFDISFAVRGRPPLPPDQQPSMQIRVVTPEYFRTLGIPIVRGRGFSGEDREGTTPVVLISQTAARRFFAGEDPMGKTIDVGLKRRANGATAGGQVVGIVGDVKDAALDKPSRPVLYLPLRQWPVTSMSVVLKTATNPESLAAVIPDQVHAIDPDLPVSNIRPLDQVVAKSISQPRFYTVLLTIFAIVALVLAAIGIFGVLSYAVVQRTREIGIRMAIGAHERTVVALIVRQAMLLTATGIAAGIVAALVLSRILSGMLFEVRPTDPVTYAAVGMLLAAVAFLASYLPARRASRIDPLTALRAE